MLGFTMCGESRDPDATDEVGEVQHDVRGCPPLGPRARAAR